VLCWYPRDKEDYSMTSKSLTNSLLAVIVLLLSVIAVRPMFTPPTVHGQSGGLSSQVQLIENILSDSGLIPGQARVITTGWVLLDSASGGIWAYPASTTTYPAGSLVGTTKASFGSPIFVGTLTAPGQPIATQAGSSLLFSR
jgi:hypothetical protein